MIWALGTIPRQGRERSYPMTEAMQLTLNIPDRLVASLREAFGNDLNRAVLENFAAEGYRTGKLSRFQVQTILGFETRWDTENWLGDR
ncbi:MAG: UPF0175 family protein, partial [Phycisphaerales bacterium]